MPPSTDTIGSSTQVDVRGPRFAAWVTTAVLVITLIVSAFSAARRGGDPGRCRPWCSPSARGADPVGTPTAWSSPTSWRPGSGRSREREPVPPLKFAQLVGLVFAVAGVVGFASGATLLGWIATAFALVAAFLNAAFGICLGCQLYPAGRTAAPYAVSRIAPNTQATERISSMARSDVLVTSRLGREQSRRAEHRLRRGRRRHHRLRRRAHRRRRQAGLDAPTCRTRSSATSSTPSSSRSC